MSVPPATTPRGPKRAGSVTVGIASQASAGLAGPPVSAMLTAMIVWESTQAQAIRYSGRASSSRLRPSTAKPTSASASGASVHHPTQAPLAISPAAIAAKQM